MGQTPADRQVEANDDIDRIAAEMFMTMRETSGFGRVDCDLVHERQLAPWRMCVRSLLQRDVIRIGKRPLTGPPPLDGQTELESS